MNISLKWEGNKDNLSGIATFNVDGRVIVIGLSNCKDALDLEEFLKDAYKLGVLDTKLAIKKELFNALDRV